MNDILTNTREWFARAVPTPTAKNFSTQLGVHFEEVREMIAEITPRDMETHNLLLDVNIALQRLADHLKTKDKVICVMPLNRKAYLDSICDQIVTVTGCAYMESMDILGAMTEVNRSNFSKFDDEGKPIFNENMKVMKCPKNYSEPDLTPFV